MLAGYSFGAAVALEMAMQLESVEGGVASVVLLDGSHAFSLAHNTLAKQWMGLANDEAGWETTIIRTFVNKILGVSSNNEVELALDN